MCKEQRNLRDIQKPILILMLLVNRAHQCGGGRQHLVDEDEDGFFGRELDALADNIDELADGEVGGDEVFLLVYGCDVGFFYLFADYLDGELVVVET